MVEQKSRALSEAKFLEAVHKGKRFDLLLLKSKSNEEPLLRSALNEYLAAALSPDAAAFDYNEFRSQEVEAETLWNALTTLPLMTDKRVVLLELTGALKAKAAEALQRFLEKPSASTSLVMTLVYEDARETAALNWPAAVTLVEFEELKKSEQRAVWAKNYIKRSGKTLTDEALQYLIDTSSHGVGDLAAKIDHAVLYAADTNEIDVKTLMKVSGVTSEYTIFNLEDAILAQKPREAHKIARSLLEGGEEMLRLLVTHRKEILRLWQLKRMLRKPEPWQQSEEAQRYYRSLYGNKFWKFTDFKRAAKAISEDRFHEAIVGLLDVEIRAKTSAERPTRYYEWLWRISTETATSVGTQLSNTELIG